MISLLPMSMFPMMSAIYGGNTSEGSPGAMSFKHNTFRLWGYYGYEKGFLGYATNKYKKEAKAAGKGTPFETTLSLARFLMVSSTY